MEEKLLFLFLKLTFLFITIEAVPYNGRRDGADSRSQFRDQIMMPSDESCKKINNKFYLNKRFNILRLNHDATRWI